MTVVSSVVSTGTTSPSGYRLYLEMTGDNSATNSLIHTTNSSEEITSSGTLENPVALSSGTWGYAIASGSTSLNPDNGFDATYTEMESATPTNSKFAAVPASTSPAQRIAETNYVGGEDLTVYYAAMADYTTASGAYTNKILYTALADDGATHLMTVSPDTIMDTGGETITLTTALYSTAANITYNAYLLTSTQYSAVTGNTLDVSTLTDEKMTCTRTNEAFLQLICTTVETDSGIGYVYLDLPNYDEYYATAIAIESSGPAFFRIANMQDMTSDVCTSATTPLASATTVDEDGSHDGDTSYVPQSTLYDIRDGNTYTVRKLADGNCWMTQNLYLTKNMTLTSSDSNVTSDYSITRISGNTSISDGRAYDTGSVTQGAYYTWATAVAGTNGTGSICPKNWHLPSGDTTGEFQKLYNQYPSVSQFRNANGPAFDLTGYRDAGSTSNLGVYGMFWSSRSIDSSSADYLRMNSSTVSPSFSGLKRFGFSIRCVAQ